MQGESYLPHLLSVANYFLKDMLTPGHVCVKRFTVKMITYVSNLLGIFFREIRY